MSATTSSSCGPSGSVTSSARCRRCGGCGGRGRGRASRWPPRAAVGDWLASFGLVDDGRPRGRAARRRPTGWRRGCPRPRSPSTSTGGGPPATRCSARWSPGGSSRTPAREAGHTAGPAWVDDEHEVDRWIRLSEWAGGSASADDLRLPAPGERSGHVVVHPGAAAPARRWPPERWADVAATLADRGHRVVVTGTAAEADLCATVAGRHPGRRGPLREARPRGPGSARRHRGPPAERATPVSPTSPRRSGRPR